MGELNNGSLDPVLRNAVDDVRSLSSVEAGDVAGAITSGPSPSISGRQADPRPHFAVAHHSRNAPERAETYPRTLGSTVRKAVHRDRCESRHWCQRRPCRRRHTSRNRNQREHSWMKRMKRAHPQRGDGLGVIFAVSISASRNTPKRPAHS